MIFPVYKDKIFGTGELSFQNSYLALIAMLIFIYKLHAFVKYSCLHEIIPDHPLKMFSPLSEIVTELTALKANCLIIIYVYIFLS